MQAHLRTELVLAATDRAGSRRPGDGGGEPAAGSGADAALRSGMSVHVSTRQYTSVLFGARCAATGIHPSLGSVGDGVANAMVERFFATRECELLAQRRFRTHAEARTAVCEWLEVFYNRQRRHSALG
jgi:putative transposase